MLLWIIWFMKIIIICLLLYFSVNLNTTRPYLRHLLTILHYIHQSKPSNCFFHHKEAKQHDKVRYLGTSPWQETRLENPYRTINIIYLTALSLSCTNFTLYFLVPILFKILYLVFLVLKKTYNGRNVGK